jgi:hypothetical protein
MNTQTHTTGAQTMINPRWLDVLDENNVNFMVLDPMHDRKLIEQLQSRPDWIIESATEEAIFFVREELPVNS